MVVTNPTGDEDAESIFAYEEIHARWTSVYRNEDTDRLYSEGITSLVRHFPPTPRPVLDLGCGTCAHSIRLARAGFRVLACDLSEAVLEAGRRNVAAQGLQDQVDVRREDVRRLSFPDASFDKVMCWGVLMHVPELDEALDEVTRVLEQGGVLAITEVNARSLEATAERWARRALRTTIQPRRVPGAIEYEAVVDGTTLLSRQVVVERFIENVQRRGLRLRERRGLEFTQAYRHLASARGRKRVHAWNRWWYRHAGYPQAFFTNLFVFEKL